MNLIEIELYGEQEILVSQTLKDPDNGKL